MLWDYIRPINFGFIFTGVRQWQLGMIVSGWMIIGRAERWLLTDPDFLSRPEI